jgi:hypothetical protein
MALDIICVGGKAAPRVGMSLRRVQTVAKGHRACANGPTDDRRAMPVVVLKTFYSWALTPQEILIRPDIDARLSRDQRNA